MAAFARGKVVEVTENRPEIVKARVAVGGDEIEVVAFPSMSGALEPGDAVVVNTTGIELGLGTGGVGFVLWNLDAPGPGRPSLGHIVKMRYTPWQMEVLAAEEPESPHHEVLRAADSIDGMPVVACGLHSQVSAVAAGIKTSRPDARVGYLMTDGAALPIAWSDLVANAKEAGILDVTCTIGHAFGGDLESVNVFSGLIALRRAGGCDAVVVSMGPGVVGTGTALGFTAMEQGQILDAVTALRGRPVACLRINFADGRSRHQGLSHHATTALRIAAREPCTVVIPELPPEQESAVRARLEEPGIDGRHEVVVASGDAGVALLRARGLRPSSMGRSMDEIPELFLSGAAAGATAASYL